jgi:hypothetical protein
MNDIIKWLTEHWVEIIRCIFESGLLTFAAAQILRWKKTKKNIEDSVQTAVGTAVPALTKETIQSLLTSAIQPLFVEIVGKISENNEALGTVAKCIALQQQDTPESKIAIVEMLSNLKICDNKETNEEIKKFILEANERLKKEIEDRIKSLNEISESNKKIIEEANENNEEHDEEVNTYDGTNI